jgi:hypothetical protein
VGKKKSTNKTGFGSKVNAVLRSNQKERPTFQGEAHHRRAFLRTFSGRSYCR